MHRAATLGLVLLVGGACANGDAGSRNTETSAAGATPPEVHFTAKDYVFEGPDSIASGWTTFVLHNAGPSLHHLVLLRLPDDKTLDDFKAAVSAMRPGAMMPPEWAVPSGGVNPPDVGSDARAVIRMERGEYAVVCLIDVPDHVPHMMKGMIKGLTVTESTGPAAPAPTADMTVTMVNFAFAPSTPFTAGHHMIRVVNSGTQPHEFGVVKFGQGKTMEDLIRWGETYAGPFPGSSLGGAAPLMPGDVEYVPLDLTPGDYAILCFVPDPTKNDMPHMAEGMVLTFTIS